MAVSRYVRKAGAAGKGEQDKRLERLYDYTKFHIAIYLSAASGLAALISSLANDKAAQFLVALIGSPILVGAALILMMLAGACGGVVATSVTESRTFEEFWNYPQGPAWVPKRALLPGSRWVAWEHGFFWLSLVFLFLSLVLNPRTAEWLLKATV